MKRMIMCDTSVFIESLTNPKVMDTLKMIVAEKDRDGIIEVRTCDTINKEIKKSAKFLRKIRRKNEARTLEEIYNSVITGCISKTDFIDKLSRQYLQDELKVSFKFKNMKNDLLVIASASASNVSKLVSFNRRTMCRQDFLKIYQKVNKKMNIKQIEIIDSPKSFRDFIFGFLSKHAQIPRESNQ